MEQPGNRLKMARERAGFDSVAGAAAAFSWHKDTYKSHENGIRNIKISVARKYARAFRVDAEWIVFGRSPPNWIGKPDQMKFSIVRPCPQIRWESVARYCRIQPSLEGVVVIADRDISAATKAGPGTFWLEAVDDAMMTDGRNSFGEGDLVAFDPDAVVKPGDLVLAVPDDEDIGPVFRRALLKAVARGELGAAYDLVPLNPAFPTHHITGEGTGKILARLVASQRAHP